MQYISVKPINLNIYTESFDKGKTQNSDLFKVIGVFKDINKNW